MESMQQVIDQIPIRHNLVSYIIFLGVFLGILLSLVILIRASKKSNAFKVYGWSLFIQSIIAMDIFLCYTGLIKYIPHLNDSTEPLVLLLAPSIYLFVQSLLEQTAVTIKKHWIHILIPIAYFISQLKFYFQPQSIKINAYLGAYYPEINSIRLSDDFDYSYQWIKDELRWLILGSFILYIILSIRLIIKHQAKKKVVNAENIRLNRFNFSKNTALGFLAFFVLIFIVFINFDNDGGDHYIFIFHTILVCITSFVLLSESRFFENSWLADKYETSKIKGNPISIHQIETYVKTQQYYLQESASLKYLAKVLHTHPNYISQTINAGTHQNFNDFINQYRIEISKKRLLDEGYKHLTIEAIGHSVGFKSKATFYNAFKKHVAVSPSTFIKSHKSTSST